VSRFGGRVASVAAAALLSGATVAAPLDPDRLQRGVMFPVLKGGLLSGRPGALPSLGLGKVSLVAIGFTYGSRKPVEAWAAWFQRAFDAQPSVQLFEVPIIGGFGKLGKWFIDSGMRNGTPAAMHDHVMTVYSDSGDWKARLGFTDAAKDDAYLVLLDPKGIVRWLHHGPFDDARAAELSALIQDLRGIQ
jgi:hypothetical protein